MHVSLQSGLLHINCQMLLQSNSPTWSTVLKVTSCAPSGKTDPDQKPCEGWGVTEETKRAKALWLELLEESREKRADARRHRIRNAILRLESVNFLDPIRSVHCHISVYIGVYVWVALCPTTASTLGAA